MLQYIIGMIDIFDESILYATCCRIKSVRRIETIVNNGLGTQVYERALGSYLERYRTVVRSAIPSEA